LRDGVPSSLVRKNARSLPKREVLQARGSALAAGHASGDPRAEAGRAVVPCDEPKVSADAPRAGFPRRKVPAGY